MARLSTTDNENKQVEIACDACGSGDLFAHDKQLVTCNKCGHTRPYVNGVSLMIEQVVKLTGG